MRLISGCGRRQRRRPRLRLRLLLLLIDYAPFHHVGEGVLYCCCFFETTGAFLVLISHADTEQLICWNQFEEVYFLQRTLHSKRFWPFEKESANHRPCAINLLLLINRTKTFIWKVIITTFDYSIRVNSFYLDLNNNNNAYFARKPKNPLKHKMIIKWLSRCCALKWAPEGIFSIRYRRRTGCFFSSLGRTTNKPKITHE